MTSKEKQVLFLLAALNFTHILDFMIMMPLGNYLIPYFKIDTPKFSFLVSSYAFSAGLSSFLSAFFVNNYDRKKVLLIAYVGFLVGTLGCGISSSYEMLLSSRIIAGLFGGMLGAQVISIVSDLFAFERRGQAMGIVMAAFAVASTVGVPFALLLANKFTWHAPFILVVLLGFIVFPSIIFLLPSLTGHLKNNENLRPKDVIGNILNDRTQILAVSFSGLMMMGHFMIIPFINPYLEFNKGFTKSQTPLVYLFGGFCAFFAAQIIGKLSDKHGKWLVYKICVLASLPLILIITNLPNIPIALVIFIFSLWFIVATGRGVTSQALVSNVVDPKFRGSFQSFNSFMQQLGTGMASLLAGFVIISGTDGKLMHYTTLGLISIGTLLLSLVVGRLIFNDKQL